MASNLRCLPYSITQYRSNIFEVDAPRLDALAVAVRETVK